MAALPSYERWGDLTGKRVLVRVDFNSPVAEVDGELKVTDDFGSARRSRSSRTCFVVARQS